MKMIPEKGRKMREDEVQNEPSPIDSILFGSLHAQ